MSAFMCSKNTLSAVTEHIMRRRTDRPGSTCAPWYSLQGMENARKLWGELRDLNRAALVARYGEADAFGVPDVPERIPSWPSPSRPCLCKVLDCYLYQCSEGDLPETSLLYKEVERARDELRAKIVRDLPEYEAGPWDIPDSQPMAQRIL